MNTARIVPRISQRRDNHTHNNRNRQVISHSHNRHQNSDESIVEWHAPQDCERVPGKRPDHDHKHHANKRCERDLLNQRRGKHNECQKKQCRRDPRDARAPARLHVDHALPDHRTAAHTAKKAGHNIGRALRHTFLRRATALASNFAHKVERQQALDQANRRQNHGIRQNNVKRFHIERRKRGPV